MATIWSSHQKCRACDWRGMTRAHLFNVVSGLAYVFTCVTLVLLESMEVLDLSRWLTWPAAVLALAWYYVVPKLLWRANACPACKTPMEVDLEPGANDR